MQNERASKKQQELLSFVDGFIQGNGYGPSYREIMNALGYKSVSTVAIHIDNLISKGYLARRDKSARSLEVVSLNSPVSQEQKTSSTPAVNVEAELIRQIKSKELSHEQLRVVSGAFELLDFPAVVAAITEKKSEDGADE